MRNLGSPLQSSWKAKAKPQRGLRKTGHFPRTHVGEGIEMLNSVRDAPGVTFGMHLCLENNAGAWMASGGYEGLSRYSLVYHEVIGTVIADDDQALGLDEKMSPSYAGSKRGVFSMTHARRRLERFLIVLLAGAPLASASFILDHTGGSTTPEPAGLCLVGPGLIAIGLLKVCHYQGGPILAEKGTFAHFDVFTSGVNCCRSII
jgi:hypothetical protein